MKLPFPLPQPRPGEWGKAMAEFVVAFPVFLVILVGVVDLGVNFGDGVQVTQGATAAVHSAATSAVGTTTRCDLASDLPLAPLTKRLMCMTKASTHLDPSTVRVKVFYEGNDGQATTDYQPTQPHQASDVTMVLCVMSPEKSETGLLGDVFDRRAHLARVTAHVGVPARSSGDRYPATAAETPLDGQSWSFCGADDPSAL